MRTDGRLGGRTAAHPCDHSLRPVLHVQTEPAGPVLSTIDSQACQPRREPVHRGSDSPGGGGDLSTRTRRTQRLTLSFPYCLTLILCKSETARCSALYGCVGVIESGRPTVSPRSLEERAGAASNSWQELLTLIGGKMATMMCCLCACRDVGAIQKRGRSDLISLARERLYRPQTAWRVKGKT